MNVVERPSKLDNLMYHHILYNAIKWICWINKCIVSIITQSRLPKIRIVEMIIILIIVINEFNVYKYGIS